MVKLYRPWGFTSHFFPSEYWQVRFKLPICCRETVDIRNNLHYIFIGAQGFIGQDQLRTMHSNFKVCQLTRDNTRRFLFSVKDDITGEFNHTLEMDVVRFPDGNVLHIVCQGTGLQQGMFLNMMSGEKLGERLSNVGSLSMRVPLITW